MKSETGGAGGHVLRLIQEFSRGRKSGSVTIHFSQGQPVKAETKTVDKLTDASEVGQRARSLHGGSNRGIR